MHYFIDGYNLLFRLTQDGDLQTEREAVIRDLNKKISLIKLDASIVFDAAYRLGGRSRSHFDALEILFTAERETADDYILEEIQNSSSPHQETVVTSDKSLARQVRLCSGHTMSIEEFIGWLNRSYKNKLKQSKKEKPSLPKQAPPQKKKTLPPPSDAPIEAFADYYSQVFETKWDEIQKKEQLTKEASKPSKKQPPRKPRQKKDRFQEPPTPEEREATEMERWFKIFEKRSKD